MTPPAIDFLWTGPARAATTVVLAHGAGAPMDTPFMTFFAEGLAVRGYRVGRFEFPYMAERRSTGKRRPPNPTPVLLNTWRAVINACGQGRMVIGGKSMGGRMATMIADEMKVSGVVCLGYPFYGAGRRRDQFPGPRIAHLQTLTTPTLIFQGERDAMGDKPAISALTLAPAIRIHWCPDGDHDLKPRKASGLTHAHNLNSALDAGLAFLAALDP